MAKKKVLVCGATGFIGRNVLDQFQNEDEYELYGVHLTREPDAVLRGRPNLKLIKADLRNADEVEKVVQGMDIIIQGAATTTGAKDTVERPFHHVTDNAVMNAFLFRAAHLSGVKHVIFFSCTTMYPSSQELTKESDFNHQIIDKYFGVGWTKVYNEKMAEFYSRLGKTRFTVIRHSNIYGPFDKYDLERSHVCGASVTKVMKAPEGGKVVVWGGGVEIRDMLYVDDLIKFVRAVLTKQTTPFELVNVGAGTGISIRDMVGVIAKTSGKNINIEYDTSKPTIPFDLILNVDRAKQLFGWVPETSFEEGMKKTLAWYRQAGL